MYHIAQNGTQNSNIGSLANQIGTLASLDTTAKNDLVSAINEVNGKLHTGAFAVACQAGTKVYNWANIGTGKPPQAQFGYCFYIVSNHNSVQEMTTVCIDGSSLVINSPTAQTVTIRWFGVY